MQNVAHFGLFAPHARGRFAVTGRGMHDGRATKAPPKTKPTHPPPAASKLIDGPDAPDRQRRLDWATLLRRSFGIDVLRCPKCSSRMRLIATIEDPLVARKILEHLGLPARGPPLRRPWVKPSLHATIARSGEYDGIDPPSLFE